MVAEWQEDEDADEVRNRIYERFDVAQQDLQMIAGTPDYAIPRLKHVLDVLRPGILSFWIDGPLPWDERQKCLRLLSEEVVPALREHGRSLGLVDPFHRKPGSVPIGPSGKPEPVSWAQEFASASA
jgi:hypothetical protein